MRSVNPKQWRRVKKAYNLKHPEQGVCDECAGRKGGRYWWYNPWLDRIYCSACFNILMDNSGEVMGMLVASIDNDDKAHPDACKLNTQPEEKKMPDLKFPVNSISKGIALRYLPHNGMVQAVQEFGSDETTFTHEIKLVPLKDFLELLGVSKEDVVRAFG